MASENRQIMFEKFEIISCVKKDDFSGVYIATHIFLGKKIFLKTLDQSTLPDPTILQRFKREAKILAKMEHPNIIKVYDFGTFENHFYISFEYFDSKNLRQIINENVLTSKDKKNILGQILRALNYAHQNNVVHRDIKPENILIDESGTVKIADFGLAQLSGETTLTAKSTLVGTPCYMSPEQAKGESLSGSSDLFSLGIVGYELFTGKNIFLSNDIGATINNILNFSENNIESELNELEKPVSNILKGLLKSDPGNRENLVALLSSEEKTIATKQSTSFSIWRKIGVVAAPILFVAIVFSFWPRDKQTADKTENQSSQAEAQLEMEHPVVENKFVADPDKTKQLPKSVEYEFPQKRTTQINTGPGKLFVLCNPWADVYIDSKKVDTTPLNDTLIVNSGSHVLSFKNAAFPMYDQKINIEPGKTRLVSVSLDTVFGFIRCNIHPWGKLYLDETIVGESPFAQPIAVKPGRHKIKITNPNYPDFMDQVSITKIETLHYNLNFENIVNSGEMAKNSNP